MSRSKSTSANVDSRAHRPNRKLPSAAIASRGTRETVESIVLAVILAFLFRGFEAEAFVIPTGSMAPTLQGRHIDVACEQCGYRYRTGASHENSDNFRGYILETTCPICRYTISLKRRENRDYHGRPDPNQVSFTGDRILVSKFAYDLAEPQRWDVIVFKYPGNAKQNYIKRLIGLPGELVRIWHGDIYVKKGAEPYQIARKPPPKLKTMLQLVDDTNYIGEKLVAANWPSRWQDWSRGAGPSAWDIETRKDGQQFGYDGSTDADVWLRYRHLFPWAVPWGDDGSERDDWDHILDKQLPPRLADFRGQLISDYYAYNDAVPNQEREDSASGALLAAMGMHWVGDLAVEAEVDVRGDAGEILLDLVEGGVHYTCRINVADGQATLSIRGGGRFSDGSASATEPAGPTRLKGAGTYQLRFCNADNQLILWVNDHVVKFDGPTTYDPGDDVSPKWSSSDAGDAEPVGVGSRGANVRFTRLKVLRDIYYVATKTNDFDYARGYSPYQILEVLTNPLVWKDNPLFADRRDVVFSLAEDQFFPLGDNSPQSRDGRLWGNDPPYPPPYVQRDLLTGKALIIYWPHSWNRPIPFTPNFRRMGFIR